MKSAAFVLPTDKPVPATAPGGPFCAFPDRVAGQARERPAAVALVTDNETWSYAELDDFANRVAAALQRDGCAPKGPGNSSAARP